MSLITKAIWEIASHPLVQTPSMETIGFGSFLFRNGYASFRKLSNAETLPSRILNGILGTILLPAGGYLCLRGGRNLWNAGFQRSYSVLFLQNEIPKYREELHPYEKFISNELGESYLHLNASDPSPKVLWLTASYDNNDNHGALHPENFLCLFQRIRALFGQTLDIKYQVVDHPEHFCNAIQSAVKMGDLQTIVLNGHGSPSTFTFSQNSRMYVLNPLSNGCFAGMPRNAKIFLMACSTGSRFVLLNSAEWLAWISDKTVYAPRDEASNNRIGVGSLNQGELALDYCASEDRTDQKMPWFDDPSTCKLDYQCDQSITNIYHPPQTEFEQATFFLQRTLAALKGLFIGYELNQLAIATLRLSGALFSKLRSTFYAQTT